MELTITRAYHAQGTNGALWHNGVLICHTIELPWRLNLPMISCIPEGRYRLVGRYSAKFAHHLLIQGVPGRSLILIHPANNARKQLKGCLAPVTRLTGPGMGERSREAFAKVISLVAFRLQAEEAWLTIGIAQRVLAVNTPGLLIA